MAVQKKAVLKKVVVTISSVVVLLILLIGAGVGYAWHTANQTPAPTTLSAPQAPKPVTIQRAKPDPNAPAFAAVQSLTTPIAPGENGSVTVKSNLEAICIIAVEYQGQASQDSGLKRKPVDEFGLVTWAWTVGANEPEGERTVKVTCQHNDKTAFVQGTMLVTKSKEPVTAEN